MSENVTPFPVDAGATSAAPAPVRTKPTVRKVTGETCVKTVGRETFYPHVGETVCFTPTMSIRTLLVAMQLQGLQGIPMDAMSPEQSAQFAKAFSEVSDELSSLIRSWDWTDDDGNPYPTHPTPVDLRSLSVDELMWLVNAGLGAGQGEEATQGEG